MRVRVFIEADWWKVKEKLLIPYKFHPSRHAAIQFRALFYKDIELPFEPQINDVVDVAYPELEKGNYKLVVFEREWVLQTRPILFIEITVKGFCATVCQIDPTKMKAFGWMMKEDSLHWSTWDSRTRVTHWEDRPYKKGTNYDPRRHEENVSDGTKD